MKNQKGFTFIETLVAIGIILVGLVGVMILMEQSIRSIRLADDRIVATHLAQEAVEVVINIRNSNWLKEQNWLTDIPATVQGIVKYDSSVVAETPNPANYCLSLVGNVYQHAVPPCNTFFKRRVEIVDLTETISGIPVDFIEVRAIVEWTRAGQTRSIIVSDHLYDWK